MFTKSKFQHELNLWMNINFWNGYKVPPKSYNNIVILVIIIGSKNKYMIIENLYIDNIQGYVCNAEA